MDDENMRKTNSVYSLHIHDLFGKNSYREVKSYQSLKLLKKYLLKLTKAYKKAVKTNVKFADLEHEKNIFDLFSSFEERIKDSKTFGELDQSFISSQSELIFLLIGKMPNNVDKEEVRLIDANWNLNDERKIIYLQDNEQKKNVIFGKIRRGFYSDTLPEYGEIRDKYFNEFKRNNKNFVNWFKQEFPTIYLELF